MLITQILWVMEFFQKWRGDSIENGKMVCHFVMHGTSLQFICWLSCMILALFCCLNVQIWSREQISDSLCPFHIFSATSPGSDLKLPFWKLAAGKHWSIFFSLSLFFFLCIELLGCRTWECLKFFSSVRQLQQRNNVFTWKRKHSEIILILVKLFGRS